MASVSSRLRNISKQNKSVPIGNTDRISEKRLNKNSSGVFFVFGPKMYSTYLGFDISVQHTPLVNVIHSQAHLCEPIKYLLKKKKERDANLQECKNWFTLTQNSKEVSVGLS